MFGVVYGVDDMVDAVVSVAVVAVSVAGGSVACVVVVGVRSVVVSGVVSVVFAAKEIDVYVEMFTCIGIVSFVVVVETRLTVQFSLWFVYTVIELCLVYLRSALIRWT